MKGLVQPKRDIGEVTSPVIFLAGPIRGAPNWQDRAAGFLLSTPYNLVVASPRWDVNLHLDKHLLQSGKPDFKRAREWERHYLDLAASKGCIMFWLPEEEKHDCDKVYGAMTRFELGQWITAAKYDPSIRFCIGSDGKFSELYTVKYDLELDCPGKKIFDNLEETCLEAISISQK